MFSAVLQCRRSRKGVKREREREKRDTGTGSACVMIDEGDEMEGEGVGVGHVMTAEEEAEAFKALYPSAWLVRALEGGEGGVRRNGRRCEDSRSLGCAGGLGRAGTAAVSVGRTVVLAVCSLAVGEPRWDASRGGRVEVQLEMPPLAADHVGRMASRGGGGDEGEGIAEGRRIIEAAVESMLPSTSRDSPGSSGGVEQLGIRDGESCWVVKLDCVCLAYDGAVVDAAVAAAGLALARLRLPDVSVTGDGEVQLVPVEDTGGMAARGRALSLATRPVALTFGLFKGRFLLADPDGDEARSCDSLVTCVADANTGNLVALLHPGGEHLRPKLLVGIAEQASRHAVSQGRPLYEDASGNTLV